MEIACTTQEAALEALHNLAPEAPFLALGQTVFWDEPMKAAVLRRSQALGYSRKLVAGIHDTDYFAKLPKLGDLPGYHAFSHNDTTTRDLWSAAAEFSTLFGSETVITREKLQAAGLKLNRVSRARPHAIDMATEAWGWRGLASAQETRIVRETPLAPLRETLRATLSWAVENTLASVAGPQIEPAKRQGEQLLAIFDSAAARPDQTLSEFYQALLPQIYEFSSSDGAEIDVTATGELLKFNRQTHDLPRFEFVGKFLDPLTRFEAVRAYNESVSTGEMYTLDRFGSWALPFDIVIPGHGRGTLRLAPKAIIVITPVPVFVSLKTPVGSLRDLANALENKFGPECVLVGKAVSLIGMLAREFVFVFHEGASSYVRLSRELHQRMEVAGIPVQVNPILRVKLMAWDALDCCCAWLKLPTPFQQPFGVEELCAPSFARRWRQVRDHQTQLLGRLAQLRRPHELIRFLADNGWGSWSVLAAEYEELHKLLEGLHGGISEIKARKVTALHDLKQAKQKLDAAHKAKGLHWRTCIFEKEPTPEDFAQREQLTATTVNAQRKVDSMRLAWRALEREQQAIVTDQAIVRAHDQRRNLELEAELKRMKLARHAIISSTGLEKSGQRPAAWWFPLLCPEGKWFAETSARAEYYLETLK